MPNELTLKRLREFIRDADEMGARDDSPIYFFNTAKDTWVPLEQGDLGIDFRKREPGDERCSH